LLLEVVGAALITLEEGALVGIELRQVLLFLLVLLLQ
jgi:hypothetical protein